MLFTSSCNKEEKEVKALKANDIFELKYVKEYAHDYSPDSLLINTYSFNRLYYCIALHKIKDSAILFVSYQSDRSYLLNIDKDSIAIYKEEIDAGETSLWRDNQTLYFDILNKIEHGLFDSLEIAMNRNYTNMFESKFWSNGKLKFVSIWKSKDSKSYIHYKYDCCWAAMGQFKYEKTIKNDIIPLDKYKIFTPIIRSGFY